MSVTTIKATPRSVFIPSMATSKKIADHLASTTGAGGSGTFSLSVPA